MPDGDAFEAAYRRLDATRLHAPPRPAASVACVPDGGASSVRWAASRLLPRLTALAPKRRRRRPVSLDD